MCNLYSSKDLLSSKNNSSYSHYCQKRWQQNWFVYLVLEQLKFVFLSTILSYWPLDVQFSHTDHWMSNMAPHGKELSEDLRIRIAALQDGLRQWFSNFLHQVQPPKIFGFPSTTIMTNIKMQYKWLPTAVFCRVAAVWLPCSRCVCVCVCVHCCVCVHFGWVKCRAQILSMSCHFHF